jgi:hypothetical protein
MLRESSTGKLESWGVSHDAARSHDFWNSPTSWAGGNTPFSASGLPFIYVRVRNDGANLSFSIAPVGVSYSTLLSISKTHFLAGGPDEIGIFLDGEGSTANLYLFHWEVTEG